MFVGKKKNSLRFINQFLLVVKINFVDYWLHLLLLQFVGTWHFFSLNHISTKNSNDAVHILKPQSTEVWPWLNCYPLFDKAPVLIKVVSWFSLSFCICILDILSKLSWSSAFCSLISLWFQCLFLKKQSKQKTHFVFSLLLSLALKLDLGNQVAFFFFFFLKKRVFYQLMAISTILEIRAEKQGHSGIWKTSGSLGSCASLMMDSCLLVSETYYLEQIKLSQNSWGGFMIIKQIL